MVCQVISVVSDSVTLWTVDSQAPLSMGFFRQKYWRGLPFPSPGNLPVSGLKFPSLTSPALAGGFFTTGASLIAQLVGNPPALQATPVRFLGQEDLLEKG